MGEAELKRQRDMEAFAEHGPYPDAAPIIAAEKRKREERRAFEGLRGVLGAILANVGRDKLRCLTLKDLRHLSNEDWEFAQKLAREMVESL